MSQFDPGLHARSVSAGMALGQRAREIERRIIEEENEREYQQAVLALKREEQARKTGEDLATRAFLKSRAAAIPGYLKRPAPPSGAMGPTLEQPEPEFAGQIDEAAFDGVDTDTMRMSIDAAERQHAKLTEDASKKAEDAEKRAKAAAHRRALRDKGVTRYMTPEAVAELDAADAADAEFEVQTRMIAEPPEAETPEAQQLLASIDSMELSDQEKLALKYEVRSGRQFPISVLGRNSATNDRLSRARIALLQRKESYARARVLDAERDLQELRLDPTTKKEILAIAQRRYSAAQSEYDQTVEALEQAVEATAVSPATGGAPDGEGADAPATPDEVQAAEDALGPNATDEQISDWIRQRRGGG